MPRTLSETVMEAAEAALGTSVHVHRRAETARGASEDAPSGGEKTRA